jgi:hypothetical protein
MAADAVMAAVAAAAGAEPNKKGCFGSLFFCPNHDPGPHPAGNARKEFLIAIFDTPRNPQ